MTDIFLAMDSVNGRWSGMYGPPKIKDGYGPVHFFVPVRGPGEMGDKTQLLAMAFASRYKASHVLAAVFLATVLNHAIAVLVADC
jgi:hypothetical protein